MPWYLLSVLAVLALVWQGLADAVEHRHGKQRVPLLKDGIGHSVCVNDIDANELTGAIAEAWALHDDSDSDDMTM